LIAGSAVKFLHPLISFEFVKPRMRACVFQAPEANRESELGGIPVDVIILPPTRE